MRIPGFDQVRENLGIAMDTLRVAKLRSALTILGVVIGAALGFFIGRLALKASERVRRSRFTEF